MVGFSGIIWTPCIVLDISYTIFDRKAKKGGDFSMRENDAEQTLTMQSGYIEK